MPHSKYVMPEMDWNNLGNTLSNNGLGAIDNLDIAELSTKYPSLFDAIKEFLKYHTGLEEPFENGTLTVYKIYLSPDGGVAVIHYLTYGNFDDDRKDGMYSEVVMFTGDVLYEVK